jgi:hypothetical protein
MIYNYGLNCPPSLIEAISELKQVTFLTTRTSTGSKIDVFHQSQPLTQSYDITHAVRVVKNVTCLSSLLLFCVCTTLKQIWEMSDHS